MWPKVCGHQSLHDDALTWWHYFMDFRLLQQRPRSFITIHLNVLVILLSFNCRQMICEMAFYMTKPKIIPLSN